MEFFAGRFRAAWKALDVDTDSLPPVALKLSPEVVEAAQKELALDVPATFPKPGRYSGIKSLLRPLKPLAIPLATWTVIPLFGRRQMRIAAREFSPDP